MSKLYQHNGIGEIFQELTIYHGQEINISQLIVEVAGLTDLLVHLLTELTSEEIELGPI
jgi:hypothetical protein